MMAASKSAIASATTGWIETAGFNHLRLGPISRDEARALARCVGGDGLPVELVEETRRRFILNVSEELAFEALASRLQRVLQGS